MQPSVIKALLKLRGVSQADIARQCGHCAPSQVYQVIEGIARSKKIEVRIATATRLPLAELWPQWYGPNAQPRSRRSIEKSEIADALRALAG